MNARNAILITALTTLGTLAARHLEAQEGRWSVEGRVGSALPTGDLTRGAMDQTAGMSFGADLMYTVKPTLTVFGGAGHQSFNCDGCSTDVSSTGLDGGLKFLFGSNENAMPWMRAGVLVARPEVGDAEGDWNPGLDSGVGIDWSVTPEFTLVPALRYSRYAANDNLTLSYFTIDLGGHLHFGS